MAPSIKGFHPENIPGIVSNLRLNGTTASFCFGTADRPLSGKQCLIYAVQFPDGVIWAVRVPTQANHLPPEAVTVFVEMEVSILKHVETSGFSRSPRLLGYNSGFDNPVGFPYIVLTWIEGTPVKWSDSIPSDRDTRNKFLRQMADITLELADCTQEWRPKTASTYLTDLIDRKIVRVSNGQVPRIQLRDCFIQRALVPRVVHFPLENSPFLISHEDLSPDNIIIDNEYNIKGIIDWGFATLLPLQFAVYFPRILAIEPSQIDAPQPPNIAAFSLAFFQPSPVLQTDRRYFTSYLSSRRSSLARSISLVLSTPDVDWRHLVFEAASSKGLHKWMAERSWLLHSSGNGLQDLSSIVLAEEVAKFLAGTVGQKSNLTRERILGTFQYVPRLSDDSTPSSLLPPSLDADSKKALIEMLDKEDRCLPVPSFLDPVEEQNTTVCVIPIFIIGLVKVFLSMISALPHLVLCIEAALEAGPIAYRWKKISATVDGDNAYLLGLAKETATVKLREGEPAKKQDDHHPES